MEPAQWAMEDPDVEWVLVVEAASSALAAELEEDFVDAGREAHPTAQTINITEKIWKQKRRSLKLNWTG